jgi:hypothetical protein
LPLIAANFLLALVVISDLTGTSVQGPRCAYLEAMTRHRNEPPR